MTNDNDFKFNYKAPTTAERREIEGIRNSYLKPSDKLALLRKLDGKVKNLPMVIALTLGTIGLFVFGLGVTMVLEWGLLVWGIIVGVFGLPFMIIAYPIYNIMVRYLKDKYSEEILKLSEELLNDENEK